MNFEIDFAVFQKTLKDFTAVVAKSPLASAADAKDLGGLITANPSEGSLKIEVGIKGFYMSATIPCEVAEAGSVVIRVDSVISLKSSIGIATLTCSDTDKVMHLKSGRFKADIPIHHDIADVTASRADLLPTTHSIHTTKLKTAIDCVDLGSASKDEPLFAKFVFNPSGFTVWANSPSTAALYRNVKSAFDEVLEITLPVEFLVAYLSKVTGKVQLAVSDSLFQLISDEIEVSHPLRELDVFDTKTAIEEIVADKEYITKFSCAIAESIDSFTSVSCFAPEDHRMLAIIDPKKNSFTCKTSSESGEGENSFSISDPEGKAVKPVECPLNCKVVIKLLESIKSLGSDEVTWFILRDRILLQSKDSMSSYICAHME